MTEQAYKPQQGSLVDVLDRLLGTGVVLDGDIVLSVADIDLVSVTLKALIASTQTIRPGQEIPIACTVPLTTSGGGTVPGPAQEKETTHQYGTWATHPAPKAKAIVSHPLKENVTLKDADRINMDSKKVEEGLVKLVMTVVELLRQLMEKQALRRIEGGSLSADDVDRLGIAFKKLKEKCEELKKIFGLEGEDLNLDLGPLGNLLEKNGG